jgi:hypothetical protein
MPFAISSAKVYPADESHPVRVIETPESSRIVEIESVASAAGLNPC